VGRFTGVTVSPERRCPTESMTQGKPVFLYSWIVYLFSKQLQQTKSCSCHKIVILQQTPAP